MITDLIELGIEANIEEKTIYKIDWIIKAFK